MSDQTGERRNGFHYTEPALRLARRRAAQKTEAFKDRYRHRSGVESTMHIKNIPGRKSDVNDATWISDFLAHGLIRSSFVPPVQIQELRDLTRRRKQFVLESARHVLTLTRG